jgi:hypothetical protein
MDWKDELHKHITRPRPRSGKTWEQIRQEWKAVLAEVQAENTKMFEGMTIQQVYDLLKAEELNDG